MAEEIFLKTHYRDSTGRYIVTIPIKPNCNSLGDSRGLAVKQFKQLECRFRKNPELKEKYVNYMRESIALGYMQPTLEPKAGEKLATASCSYKEI